MQLISSVLWLALVAKSLALDGSALGKQNETTESVASRQDLVKRTRFIVEFGEVSGFCLHASNLIYVSGLAMSLARQGPNIAFSHVLRRFVSCICMSKGESVSRVSSRVSFVKFTNSSDKRSYN